MISYHCPECAKKGVSYRKFQNKYVCRYCGWAGSEALFLAQEEGLLPSDSPKAGRHSGPNVIVLDFDGDPWVDGVSTGGVYVYHTTSLSTAQALHSTEMTARREWVTWTTDKKNAHASPKQAAEAKARIWAKHDAVVKELEG